MQFDQFKEWIENTFKGSVQQIIDKIFYEINQNIEKYKKLGEEEQSEEMQKIRESLNNAIQIIEKILQTFDLKFTEFLIDLQKNFENFLTQFQQILKEENFKDIQQYINDFANELLKFTPEKIFINLRNFLERDQNQEKENFTDRNNDEISFIFSESDTKKKEIDLNS